MFYLHSLSLELFFSGPRSYNIVHGFEAFPLRQSRSQCSRFRLENIDSFAFELGNTELGKAPVVSEVLGLNMSQRVSAMAM